MTWSSRPGPSDGRVELLHRGVVIAELMWCRRAVLETVATSRIVESLNRPVSECRPCPTPIWESVRLEGYAGLFEEFEFRVIGDRTPAAPLIMLWIVRPRRFDGWVQRVVDALNPGHGLPAVTLVEGTRGIA